MNEVEKKLKEYDERLNALEFKIFRLEQPEEKRILQDAYFDILLDKRRFQTKVAVAKDLFEISQIEVRLKELDAFKVNHPVEFDEEDYIYLQSKLEVLKEDLDKQRAESV